MAGEEVVIEKISPEQVLRDSRALLGLPDSGALLDESMFAASVRRAAGIHCPCSRATLVSAIEDALQYLTSDDGIQERVGDTVEGLIIGGDLLELSNVATDDPDVKGTWVFPAPPGFVVRRSGSAFILGVLPDEASPLPSSMSVRIAHDGFARVLSPLPSEDLPSILRGLGLLEISEAVWLKAPKQESAADLLGAMNRRVQAQPISGEIADISILDPARGVNYYRGRWIAPSKETGSFVARRPQAYGSPLWGFAYLEQGQVVRFLDFPLKGSRWGGCDAAWHLQMAIDHCRATPQLYRLFPMSDGPRFDFFSPLPVWAQRRLAIVGRPVRPEKCLLSYQVPDREAASEEAFLQQRLWLKRTD